MGNIDFTGVFVMAFIGMFVCFVGAGAACGALVTIPFALWQHDWSLLVWPSSIGGALGAALFAWAFRGEFTFGRR